MSNRQLIFTPTKPKVWMIPELAIESKVKIVNRNDYSYAPVRYGVVVGHCVNSSGRKSYLIEWSRSERWAMYMRNDYANYAQDLKNISTSLDWFCDSEYYSIHEVK